MATRSDTSGYQCTAVWNGVRCPAMMEVDDTKHLKKYGYLPTRYRLCEACGNKQLTIEIAAEPAQQPKFPIDIKKRRELQAKSKAESESIDPVSQATDMKVPKELPKHAKQYSLFE